MTPRKAAVKNRLGPNEIDGRAYYGQEDWGRMYHLGDPLECCGCIYGPNRDATICECRCHDTVRFLRSGSFTVIEEEPAPW